MVDSKLMSQEAQMQYKAKWGLGSAPLKWAYDDSLSGSATRAWAYVENKGLMTPVSLEETAWDWKLLLVGAGMGYIFKDQIDSWFSRRKK